MTGSVDNSGTSTFDCLPPVQMGSESDANAFTTTGPDGQTYGNLVFEDIITSSNDPGTSITIYEQYTLPMQPGETLDQFKNRIIANLNSDNPTPIPDSDLSVHVTVNTDGAITNLDSADIAAAEAMYGAPFVKECLSQGKDPSSVGAKISAVINQTINTMTPPPELSDEQRTQLALELLVSEGNDNVPLPNPNPATKSIYHAALAELKKEDKTDGSSDAGKPSTPPPTQEEIQQACKNLGLSYQSFFDSEGQLNSGAMASFLGEDFAQACLKSGQDPVKFLAKALVTLAALSTTGGLNLQPPFSEMTHDQKVALFYEILIASSGDDSVSPTRFPNLTPTQISDIQKGLKTNLAAIMNILTTMNHGSSVVSAPPPPTQINLEGNQWLAGNPMVAFAVVFLEVVRLMMKNKFLMGKFENAIMKQTMALAKTAASLERKLGRKEQMQAIMGAVSGAMACGMAAFGARTSMKGASEEEADLPEQQPEGVTFTTKSEDSVEQKAVVDANADMKSQDVQIAKQQRVVQAKRVEEKDATETASKEEETVRNRQYEDNDNTRTADQNNDGRTAKERYNPTKTQRDTDEAEVQAVRSKNIDHAKTEREQSEKDLKTLQDKRTKSVADYESKGLHVETSDEYASRRESVRKNNMEARQKQTQGQFMTQSAFQLSGAITSSMSAYTTMAEANIKGAQQLIQGLQQIVQTMLSKMSAAISTSSDNISAFLAAIKEIEQAVARAQSELMK